MRGGSEESAVLIFYSLSRRGVRDGDSGSGGGVEHRMDGWMGLAGWVEERRGGCDGARFGSYGGTEEGGKEGKEGKEEKGGI